MKKAKLIFCSLEAAMVLLWAAPDLRAEQHRATHLGHPATRFAPPVSTPEELRSIFRNPKLKPDVASILKQMGWKGNPDDLLSAAQTAEIKEVKIPVGATMPFMASREQGKPVCLRNVLWAGKEPISAYAFDVTSHGRRYRCVTPKPCSNFYLEEIVPPAPVRTAVAPKPAEVVPPKPAEVVAPKPAEVAPPRLALECEAPAEVLAGRPATVCLMVRNQGAATEPNLRVTLPVPAGSIHADTDDGSVLSENQLVWGISNLAAGDLKKLCATFTLREPGSMSFNPTARGGLSRVAQSVCATRVVGIPAILLEVVDKEDPIQIGDNVDYEVTVTNQGSAPLTNLRLVCTLEVSQDFISGSGATAVRGAERTVTTEPLGTLASKAAASWHVVVKAVQAGDIRFKAEVSGDQFKQPIAEDESTRQY